jgi:thioredoxin-like negative regulator of GroEL
VLERLLLVLAVALVAAVIAFLVRSRARGKIARVTGEALSPDVARRLGIERTGIIYFSGPHCAPCTRQAAILAELARERGVQVVTVDAARETALTTTFHIMTVPATVVVDAQRRVRAVNLGLQPRSVLDRQLTTA